MKKVRLNSLKDIQRFYQRIINQYYQNDESLSENRFKHLCYALNGLAKVIESSELEQRIEQIESELTNNPNTDESELDMFN